MERLGRGDTLAVRITLTLLRLAGYRALFPPLTTGVWASPDLGNNAFTIGPVILIGTLVLEALPDEIAAIILHEQAHQTLGHTWKSLASSLLPPPLRARAIASMEHEADALVAAAGKGPALGTWLYRTASTSALNQSRIRRLLGRDPLDGLVSRRLVNG